MGRFRLWRVWAVCGICALCALYGNETKENMEVSAKNFHSNLKKGITELEGEVIVSKGDDRLWADKVIIEMDKNNKPLKYTAIGNVRFLAKLPEREMRGRAKRAIYDAKKDEYQLIDNAFIEEVGKKNTIKGNVIIFNPKTQEASIQGSNQKPGVMTFIIEDSKK